MILHGGGNASDDRPPAARSGAAAADRRRPRPAGGAGGDRLEPAARRLPHDPQNRPKHFYPGSRWVDWVGTDFYSGYPEWDALTGLYRRFSGKPFAIAEWAVEGEDPSFVRQLFAWVDSHRRCRMLVYYQDFGATSSYRIQNYGSSLGVLRARLHSGLFPAYAKGAPHLPPPPPGGIGAG